MRAFLEAHWGDLLALYILHLGLLVMYVAHGDTDIQHVGESFILLAAGTLRFKGIGSSTTNGAKEPITTTTTTTKG